LTKKDFVVIIKMLFKRRKMFQGIGLTELIIIILVLIIFFGSKRITQLARQAGQATKELKKIKKEYKETLQELGRELPTEEEERAIKNQQKEA